MAMLVTYPAATFTSTQPKQQVKSHLPFRQSPHPSAKNVKFGLLPGCETVAAVGCVGLIGAVLAAVGTVAWIFRSIFKGSK